MIRPSYQTLETTPTPMVPVFSLNLLPPFMAPNSGKVFLGFSCSELLPSHQHTSKGFNVKMWNNLQSK